MEAITNNRGLGSGSRRAFIIAVPIAILLFFQFYGLALTKERDDLSEEKAALRAKLEQAQDQVMGLTNEMRKLNRHLLAVSSEHGDHSKEKEALRAEAHHKVMTLTAQMNNMTDNLLKVTKERDEFAMEAQSQLTTLMEKMSNLNVQMDQMKISKEGSTKQNENGAFGATGSRFSGIKTRTFDRRDLSTTPIKGAKIHPLSSPGETPNACHQWAVVTTINPPNDSINYVGKMRNWCLVIVGDTITPDEEYRTISNQENVFYLSAAFQKDAYMGKGLPFVDRLPFKSFARKNLGYLFAISHGAKVIFDFDDDNVLLQLEDGETTPPPFRHFPGDVSHLTVLLKYTSGKEEKGKAGNSSCDLAFNPYTYMNPSLLNTWPRGFPIECLRDNLSRMRAETVKGDLVLSSIGVFQSLCNVDPDNDSILRMTRIDSTNFYFDRSISALPIMVPFTSYSPYNAQATTHLYSAFWGLYLPITVPGRVTDIWRSYITQRIFKDLNLYVLYTPPIVNHLRSAHDYVSDFVAETDLYTKTTKLLDYLNRWSSNDPHLAQRILDLWIGLYEHEFIELADVIAVKEWLEILSMVGYEFPEVAGHLPLLPQAQPLINDQPFRVFPYFDIDVTRGKVTNLPNTGQLTMSQFQHVSWRLRPPNAIVKIIMMTMNEWPLVKSWIFFHGEVVGFHNLYILDSSTDPRCLSFMRYARDILGANVIFADINLNEIAYG
ncbi:hypothetical protein ACHAXR_003989 [Thalassiosira sp. AJA248-18]